MPSIVAVSVELPTAFAVAKSLLEIEMADGFEELHVALAIFSGHDAPLLSRTPLTAYWRVVPGSKLPESLAKLKLATHRDVTLATVEAVGFVNPSIR